MKIKVCDRTLCTLSTIPGLNLRTVIFWKWVLFLSSCGCWVSWLSPFHMLEGFNRVAISLYAQDIFLGYDDTSLGKWLLPFRRKIVPSFSKHCGLFIKELEKPLSSHTGKMYTPIHTSSSMKPWPLSAQTGIS